MANQPDLLTAIDRLCTTPPPLAAADCVAQATTCDKGHGRLELRTLERSAALNDYLAWPDVGQVLRRICQRVDLTKGAITEEITYDATSLPPAATAAGGIATQWRGHWAIENKVYRVRDGTFGNDASQDRAGAAPQALAALRNGLLSLRRVLGWTNIADVLRHYAACAHRAIRLLHTTPSRL